MPSTEDINRLNDEEVKTISSNATERKKYFESEGKLDNSVLMQKFGELAEIWQKIETQKKATDNPKKIEKLNTTIIALWKKGYTPEEFLGAGSFGIVCKCKDQHNREVVVKYIPNVQKYEKGKVLTMNNIHDLNQSLETDMKTTSDTKTSKAKKHLNMFETENNDNAIIKGSLAEEDLENATLKKRKEYETNLHYKEKTIDSLLRKSMQALKDVKYLHDKGFSHNDIKPENFLKTKSDLSKQEKKLKARNELREKREKLKEIEQEKNTIKKYEELKIFLNSLKQLSEFKNKSNKISGIIKNADELEKLIKSKKDTTQEIENNLETKINEIFKILKEILNKSKSMIQLTDLDFITKIEPYEKGSDEYVYGSVHTPRYFPPQPVEQKYLTDGYAPKAAVEKRDVYALGITFLWLMVCNEELISTTLWDDYFAIRTHEISLENYCNELKDFIYGGEKDTKRIAAYVQLILNMTEEWKQRFTIEEAISKLGQI